MEFNTKLKIKEEHHYLQDNNENYLKDAFDINVKVEETEINEDWCIQNLITANVQDTISYIDLKQECLETCIICLQFFTDSFSLYKHNLKHLKVPLVRRNFYICNDCHKHYTKKIDLQMHILTHMEKTQKGYNCNICSKTYNYKSWCRHMKDVHTSTKLTCNKCNNKFKCEKTLKRHIMYVHNGVKPSWRFHNIDSGLVKCSECPKQFTNKSSLTSHIRNCHDRGVHQCKICKSVLKSKAYLATHINRVHYDDGTVYGCDVCGKSFKSPRYLRVHERNSHS